MKNLNLLLPLTIAAFLIYSCTPDPKLTPPVLTSAQVTQITYTTATAGGELTDIGGAYITAKGVCWSTSVEPTIDNNRTTESGGLGVFTSQLTGLTPSTMYYVRAYGTNSAGTAYGNEVSFKTLQLEVPVLTTTEITSITQTTAVSGGNITDDNGGSVTARGVCWGTATNPTTADSKTTDGTGTGSFVSNLIGLQPGTVYYVRSYATNSVGTAYGNEISFTTSAVPTTVPGAPTIGTATAGNAQAVVTFTAPGSNGGSAITGYTVTSSPDGKTGTGSVSPITVTGLNNGTAYTFTVTATNAIGNSVASSASNSVILTAPVTDIDGNVYNTVTIGTQVWMAENLKTTKYNNGTAIPNVTENTAWAALTTGAYSDYNNTPSNSTTYGRLYNWYTVDNNAVTKVASNGGKNVCPTSWHVPTDAEWAILIAYLGGESVAIAKLRETGSIGATNESGFTALSSGYRYNDGTFYYFGDELGAWWSATELDTSNPFSSTWFHFLMNSDPNLISYNLVAGLNVRCLRDY
jgi:uncharacterized protein (TIGR02145 family)